MNSCKFACLSNWEQSTKIQFVLPANNGAVEQGAILLAVLASSRDHKAHAVAIHDGFMSKFVNFCCGLLLSHTGQKQDMQNHPVVDALHQIHEKARMVLPNWIQISKYKYTTKQKGAVGLKNVEQARNNGFFWWSQSACSCDPWGVIYDANEAVALYIINKLWIIARQLQPRSLNLSTSVVDYCFGTLVRSRPTRWKWQDNG